MPTFAIKSQFDCSSRQNEKSLNRYDAVMADRLTQSVSCYESGAKYNGQNGHRFDAENITPANATMIRFDSEGRGLCKTQGSFDAIREFEHPTTGIPAKYEWLRSYDTATSGCFQGIRPSFQQISNQFDAILYQKYVGASGRFDANAAMYERLSNSFDIMPGYQYTAIAGRFDVSGNIVAAVPIHKQAFVLPGWRVLIRNTETNEKRDLGFIGADAVEKSIKDVNLPDGDYEITVLYSSLFWKDALDRVVRNVTIRSGEEPVLGLPPVLNLTSEIIDGITTISWSSNSGDYENCEFGLWFSETPPVVTFREPDQTVAYTTSDVDYSVHIKQTTPLWCVVMPVKDNMRGPASEIFLDWNTGSPRRPDDQIAFDVFIDANLQQLKNASRQVEDMDWDTTNGYWA